MRIFQVVLNIQSIITRIPGQIERQQPVYLVDALGREKPLRFRKGKAIFPRIHHISRGSFIPYFSLLVFV